MNKKYLLGFIGIGGVLIVLFIFYPGMLENKFPDIEKRGQYGDSFGGLNSMISALAFFGIIVSIFLQNEDLRMQREELKSTRKELARSAKAQEQSEKALSKQVESMELTAKISALSSLIDAYSSVVATKPHPDFGVLEAKDALKKRREVILELEEIRNKS